MYLYLCLTECVRVFVFMLQQVISHAWRMWWITKGLPRAHFCIIGAGSYVFHRRSTTNYRHFKFEQNCGKIKVIFSLNMVGHGIHKHITVPQIHCVHFSGVSLSFHTQPFFFKNVLSLQFVVVLMFFEGEWVPIYSDAR